MVFAPKKPQSGPSAPSARLVAASLSWEEERATHLEKSEARAWNVARAATAVAVLSVTAIAVLSPFYKIIPVVFKTDNLSGEILEVQVGPTNLPHSEIADKHWLATYVQTRERYVWTLLQTDFDTVMALSDETVANDYRAIYDGPNALDKKLGETTDIRVKLVSVQILPGEPGKGLVTWDRTLRQKGLDVDRKRFISTISYKYSPPEALSKEQKLIANPFGFKVDGYAVSTVTTTSSANANPSMLKDGGKP